MPRLPENYHRCNNSSPNTKRVTSITQMSSAFSALASLNYYRSSLVQGRKQMKNRVTFLVCTEVHGTKRIPPLVVKRENAPSTLVALAAPRSALTTNQEGRGGWILTYLKTGCIALTLLYDALGGAALLLLDNASSHRKEDDSLFLRYVHVKFLPKRTASILQPLYLGVIAAIKKISTQASETYYRFSVPWCFLKSTSYRFEVSLHLGATNSESLGPFRYL